MGSIQDLQNYDYFPTIPLLLPNPKIHLIILFL